MTELLLCAVLAFAAPENFQVPAENGGGSGMRFTGSPASKYDCSVCHTADRALTLEVTATPELFAAGYAPGSTYELELSLGATPLAGAFAIDVVSRQGTAAGTFSPSASLPAELQCDNGSDPVSVVNGGTLAQSVSCKKGLGRWRVRWTAPASDVGPVTVYVSAVSGNLDGSFTGDRTSTRVIGIASPSSRTTGGGCGGAAVLLPIALLGLMLRRRGAGLSPLGQVMQRRGAVLALLGLVLRRRGPVLSLLLIASVARAEDERPAAMIEAGVGAGSEALALEGPAFATPLRLQMTFPQATLAVTIHPARWTRTAALDGLQLRVFYARGWSTLPSWLGTSFANPTDAELAAGFRFGSSAWLTPRVVYRARMVGIEKNAFLDDVLYQGLGAELEAGVAFGPVELKLRPQVLRLFDSGTLSTAGYGAFQGGWLLGGEASVGLRLGARWSFSGGYAGAWTNTTFAGAGERSLGLVRRIDLVHRAMLRFSYSR